MAALCMRRMSAPFTIKIYWSLEAFFIMQVMWMYRLIFIIVCGWCSFTSSAVVADKITANIQRDLNLLGYNAGPVDSVAGSNTISSLEAFYKDYCGEYDGEIGSNDAEAVKEYAARYASNRNPNKGLVKDTPKNPWAHRFTSTVARSGTYSQRIELRSDDCSQYDFYRNRTDKFGCKTQRERSEIIFHEWNPGNNVWIGFSMKFDPTITPDPVSDWYGQGLCTSFAQIKPIDHGVNQQKFVNSDGFVGGASPFFLRVCGNDIWAHVNKTSGKSVYKGDVATVTYKIGTTKQFKDDWVDITINFDDTGYKSQPKQSLLRIFVNGEEKVMLENFRQFFPDIYWFKYGFYRSQLQERLADYGNQKKASTLIAYFDEVRVGSSMEDVTPNRDRPVD